jgi:hypothetical protein
MCGAKEHDRFGPYLHIVGPALADLNEHQLRDIVWHAMKTGIVRLRIWTHR